MNGTPPPSFVWACATTLSGTSGLFWMPGEERRGQRGDEHGAGQRGADRRAELRAGVLEAADLAALLVGHRRTPSRCRAARPSRRARRRRAASARSRSPGRRRCRAGRPAATRPANSAMNPSRTTRRGEAFGNSLGMPAANRSSVSESGSSRTPVSIADSPSATDRNSGTTKKRPAWRRNRKRNDVTPPRSWRLRSIAGSMSAPSPRRMRRFSHHRKSAEHHAAAEDEPDHRREPEPLAARPAWAARSPTSPSAGCRSTTRPRPSADSAVPTRSSRAPSSAGVSFMRRVSSEDHEHDEDLAGEHPAPRGVGREHAADQRPGAAAIAPAEATSP